ncbi:MAG: hypothetical protein JXQ90_03600 [Cyclobacteriaceae bacterium]
MMKRLAVINTLSVILVLFVNFLASTGKINNLSVSELSNEYENLFTPAGYAFSIWGIIFLGLIVYSVFQLKSVFIDEIEIKLFSQIGYWLSFANLGNALWLIAWLYEYTLASVCIMLFILFSLLMIVVKTNIKNTNISLKINAFVRWPMSLYAGWITVATIANVAAFLSKINWDGGPFTESTWTIVMIIVATILNLIMIWRQNIRVFAFVGIWAIIAIYVRHKFTFESIAFAAISSAAVLLINVLIHAYRYRHTRSFMN